jgi:hypothetical protein
VCQRQRFHPDLDAHTFSFVPPSRTETAAAAADLLIDHVSLTTLLPCPPNLKTTMLKTATITSQQVIASIPHTDPFVPFLRPTNKQINAYPHIPVFRPFTPGPRPVPLCSLMFSAYVLGFRVALAWPQLVTRLYYPCTYVGACGLGASRFAPPWGATQGHRPTLSPANIPTPLAESPNAEHHPT